MLKQSLLVLYSQLTASNITRKFICNTYYETNDLILKDQLKALDMRKVIVRKMLAWNYKERFRSILSGNEKYNQELLTDIRFLRVELVGIDETKKVRKERYDIR